MAGREPRSARTPLSSEVDPVTAYFSVLRWRRSTVRDEAKNVGVLAVAKDASWARAMVAERALPEAIHKGGFAGSVLEGLRQEFAEQNTPERLFELHAGLVDSLVLTQPQTAIIEHPDQDVRALFRAYVAPASGGPTRNSKSELLDRTVRDLSRQLRGTSYNARLRERVQDYQLEGAVFNGTPKVGFAALTFPGKIRTLQLEYEAVYFISAARALELPSVLGVVHPTADDSIEARESARRVLGWASGVVEVVDAEQLPGAVLDLVNAA